MCKLEWSSDQGAPHYSRWSWNRSPVYWNGARRIIHITCLYGIFTGCVWMHAQIPENHRQCEWTKIKRSRDDSRNTLPMYFPESLCERGFREDIMWWGAGAGWHSVQTEDWTDHVRFNASLIKPLVFCSDVLLSVTSLESLKHSPGIDFWWTGKGL